MVPGAVPWDTEDVTVAPVPLSLCGSPEDSHGRGRTPWSPSWGSRVHLCTQSVLTGHSEGSVYVFFFFHQQTVDSL